MILIEVTSKYQGSTNIRLLEDVFFSIKNKKFIKPIRRLGNSVSGQFLYNLLPGNYITMSYDCWSKRNPSVIFTISLVQIIPKNVDGKTYTQEIKKKVELRYDSGTRINQRHEILKEKGFVRLITLTDDFVKAVPGYHIVAGLFDLAKKRYDDETVDELLNFLDINNNKTLYYQQEID